MPNEKDSVTNFLNEVSETKVDDLFKEESTEEPVVEESEDEKPLPFHRDPKVQRYVERQIEKALKDVKPSAEREFREAVDDIKLPSSFVKLIGNDTPEKVEVLKDLSNYFGNLKGEARKEFLEEMQEQQRQVVEADNAAVDELQNGFETIEEVYGVDLDRDTKTRASFIEYLRKVSPKNADGEVKDFADIPSTWETFQELNKRVAQPSRAKELASRGMTRSSDATHEIPKGNSWKDTDRYFAQLAKTLN